MYPDGYLNHPVNVTISPWYKWKSISTGLDPRKGMPHAYYAPDFDVLYDCPVLAGNQQVLTFKVQDIPHYVAMEYPVDIDTVKYISDLKKIVEEAVKIIGEIPYEHYTFLIMGEGRGGLEHRNSMAVYSSGNYYTLADPEETLEHLQNSITGYENMPGHLFQPVTMSSFDSWIYFLNRSENASNTTISYYDKGCALGMLLDLKIRYETKSEKSLDDVMRTLYYEFQDVCEKIAGCSMDEIFSYASTTQKIDYPKYLSYAGLQIDTAWHDLQGIQTGLDIDERNGKFIVSGVEWDSPAWTAGLSPGDTIHEINDKQATSVLLYEILASGKPGHKLEITVGRRTGRHNVEIIPVSKKQKTFDITRSSQPDPYQARILNSWLKN
jgi:predicted metalloprotease with PDZ domain